MTFSQTRKLVLKRLREWRKPPVVTTTTNATNVVEDPAGANITLGSLLAVVGQLHYDNPPSEWVVVSPHDIERFAETVVNQSLFDSIRIVADPTVPPNEAYLIHPPQVAQW